tara:strand:+ start:21 stop:482 length:462 start_codon:yes stop_codon:yes gene_type:complete
LEIVGVRISGHFSLPSIVEINSCFCHNNDKPSAQTGCMAWLQLAVRLLLSGGLIVGASEIAKKNDVFGAFLASLPLISVFAMIWLYNDTGDTEQIATFSKDIFWLVIPSLVLFLTLPFFLQKGMEFWPALGIAIILTVLAYALGLKIASGSTS